MADKEIKQKIVLAGEKEYSQALRDANRNLKTLKSELKAETAELGANATAQQNAKTRTKNLNKQIAEQEKIVRTYRAALEEVREKYGDNEDAIASWETKLNNARATLGNMRNELDGVGSSLKTMQVNAATAVTASKSVADSIGQIASVGESVSDKIESIFTGMVNVIRDVMSEVWAMITDTAAKANEWTDIAGIWNTSPQTIQQWARAVQASANSFGDLEASMNKVVMGDHDKIAQLTGVSWMGDTDQWQYAIDVMSSIASMDYTHQMDALEQIFGDRRAVKIKDILNDWGEIVGLVPQFNGNETGYGMTDEDLETMNDLSVQIATVEAKWDALKDKIAAGLGTAAMGLAVSVEGAMDGVAEYFNAKNESEKQAALEKIRKNVEDFFTKLGEIIQECITILHDVGQELQNSDDPVTKFVGNMLVGLSNAFQWIVENQGKVIEAFEAIFGAFLVGKIAAAAGTLMEMVKNIETLKMFKGFRTNPNLSGIGTGSRTGTDTGVGGGSGLSTSQTVTNQTVTNASVTSATVPTATVTTSGVTPEYVQIMVGGTTPSPTDPTNPTTPTTPSTPSFPNLQSLPGNGATPLLNAGGGNGLNDYVPVLPSGGSGLNLPGGGDINIGGGSPTVNIGGGSPQLNLPSGSDVNLSGGGSTPIRLDPNEFDVTEAGKPQLRWPEDGPPQPEKPTDNGGGGFGAAAAIFAVWGAALYGATTGLDHLFGDAQRAKDIEERENTLTKAEEAAEALGEEVQQDVEMLTRLANALGPTTDEEGNYKKNFTFSTYWEPTNDLGAILGDLGDLRKRGLLHADIEKWGARNGLGETQVPGTGYEAWDLLRRYWGVYESETWPGSGEWRHEDYPLDPQEQYALLEYLKDMYTRKLEEQMENTFGAGAGTGSLGAVLPPSWRFMSADQWNGVGHGSSQQEGVSSQDLQGFRGLPGQVAQSAREGVAAGISGIKVYMDGTVVGHLVAPVVSREIARQVF